MVVSESPGDTGGRPEELAGAGGDMVSLRSPARQSRFHNFSFPTVNWGTQRILRCVNPVSGIGRSTTPEIRIEPEAEMRASSSTTIPPPVPNEKEGGQENASAEAARPLNLRKRRAACYAPAESGRKQVAHSSPSNPPLGKGNPGRVATRRSAAVGENGRRREFSISLSRQEIEEDFFAFKAAKPKRRPKKRPKAVQKQLDNLFPGFWLPEITADRYK